MISKSAEYALRIMAYFAIAGENTPVRSRDLAPQVNIPGAYLSKILRRMVNAELLTAAKGHGGGFIIARQPQKIRFSDILAAIDQDSVTPACVFGWDACSDKNPCALHDRWKVIRNAFNQWAYKTTLADVAEDLARTGGSIESSLRERIRNRHAGNQNR
jgi:Rrf2 family iron-sulfur cluster assembly transcriptional regulator